MSTIIQSAVKEEVVVVVVVVVIGEGKKILFCSHDELTVTAIHYKMYYPFFILMTRLLVLPATAPAPLATSPVHRQR